MSNFEHLQVEIKEHYFKLFRPYNKINDTHLFISRWLSVVKTYSQLPRFIAFEPKKPILDRLVFSAKGVVLVPFSNTKVCRLPRYTSVFPYYPFRVKQEYTDTLCKIGLEFFHLYLKITGIRLVCLYSLWHNQEKEIIKELQSEYPNIQIYLKNSYSSFCKVMLKSARRGLKFQSRSINSVDKISQSAAP